MSATNAASHKRTSRFTNYSQNIKDNISSGSIAATITITTYVRHPSTLITTEINGLSIQNCL